ncbi:hypothetical protein L228DRAFT_279901 [Xylona heveae TC161]|uniref:DUF676 domain-containing protein n=1 Tax=Xylona heveae (strain CBS 132557 / TC161) TaxID=1328760 RepID=A0A165JX78_XYLHT|nr:hypothetical protein L228DRAFT_279901 [Xylona heveae TC161]KZF26737.1 hypothetical protein L228DRAFT_279901 [Xylona heveae TC161]
MKKKTILLCFIHGFKGGDDTFGNFPQHLRQLLSNALPKVDIEVLVYPKFETRGDLKEAVARFRDWLQNKVIDLEVAKGTSSPTIDPSVRTVLIGHSMGGIVAAETTISIASERPVGDNFSEASSFMFPYIQGILAFDTPYLGIAPGVVAHGAEGHYNTASTAYGYLRDAGKAFGWAGGSNSGTSSPGSGARTPLGLLPGIGSSGTPGTSTPTGAGTGEAIYTGGDAAAMPAWQRWGRYAMFAGAAGAVAAGGAAAYMKRDQITEGWGWVFSHLEFVGCLARGEDLKKRVARVAQLETEHNLGFANLYTCLGSAAAAKSSGRVSSGVLGAERTFCSLPKSEVLKKFFHKTTNDAAKDETMAHMSMFLPRDNPGYYDMAEHARELITGWLQNEWYESADSVQIMEQGGDDSRNVELGVESGPDQTQTQARTPTPELIDAEEKPDMVEAEEEGEEEGEEEAKTEAVAISSSAAETAFKQDGRS